MIDGRWLATLVAASVGGVAGCTPATTPSPSAGPVVPSASQVTPAIATATPNATASPPSALLDEVEVLALDRDLTDSILEFASDGTSVLFSAGTADDAAAGAAPDLWRVPADARDPEPELVWRNPHRDHSIVRLAGDAGAAVFAEIPLDGSRAWDLWLLPRGEEDAILLDTHPGDEEVSSLVPSLSMGESAVAWTAFDTGAEGPVSQLLWARAPDWEPMLLQERSATEAELWLPSLGGSRLVYSEVRYADDRSTDTRSVHLLDLAAPGSEPTRLGTSELATMPVLAGETVIWKEADEGFNMFNWGRLWRFAIGDERPRPLHTAPADYVNYPSAGPRFVAWWSSDAFEFVVYDLLEDRARVMERYSTSSGANVLRPHIAGDLLVWLYVEGEGPNSEAELRYAFLPPLRAP